MITEEMRQKIKELREMGATSIVIDGLTIGFPANTNNTAMEVPEVSAEDLVRPPSALDEITDEEILYWSTPYYDELQAMKREKDEEKEKGKY